MAATASVSIAGTVTDLPTGSRTIGPIDITSAAAVGQTTDVVLASGDNTITVPSTATAAIIKFDSTSTTTKTLKGVGGDTGIVVSRVGVVVMQFHTTPPASFIINSSATDTGLTTEISFI